MLFAPWKRRGQALDASRYDDEIMVNPHAYGEPASANPMLHLRRLDGGQLVDHYIARIERVWETANPWNGEEV